MSINKNLAVAALAGLLSAGFMTASVAQATDHAEKEATQPAKEKHACKGHNSCKGNSPDGKNECKGKSACSTTDSE